MNQDIFKQNFSAISLDDLKEKANMLSRSENKYLLKNEFSKSLIDKLSKEFDVLEIDGKQVFGYETIYLDDNAICYNEHLQGKRQRFKMRTRRYLDANNLCFFEMKLKGKRGSTNKFRYQCDESEHGVFTKRAEEMAKKVYREEYGKEFNFSIKPQITMDYKRITLVAKEGGERITIDFDLAFIGQDGRKVKAPKDFIIVETKTGKGNGRADKILRSESIRTVQRCSKFCTGMIVLGMVDKVNKFMPLMSRYFDADSKLNMAC